MEIEQVVSLEAIPTRRPVGDPIAEKLEGLGLTDTTVTGSTQ
jgi:hypothetical protein